MNNFWPCPKIGCLPPALNGRGKWMPRAVVLLHYSSQTVLGPSPNPTWALGSAAQLSLFLALHCIITPSSLHSLPRLCTTPLHCSITRNQHYQKPLFPSSFPCSPLHCNPGAGALQPALLCCPALCCSSSRASLVSHSPAPGFSFFTAALQKSSGSATSLQRSVAQPSSGASTLPFSSLSIQHQAATLLKHPPAFFFLTIFYTF